MRALTTTLAVFIGVALVAGTYVLTDTINNAFDDIFSESLQGTDVVITAENAVRQDSGEAPTLPAALLPRVEQVPGVELAAGGIFTPGGLFDEEGDRIGSQFAPKFISSTLPPAARAADLSGGPPAAERRRGGRSTRPPPTNRASSSATRSRSPGRPERAATSWSA